MSTVPALQSSFLLGASSLKNLSGNVVAARDERVLISSSRRCRGTVCSKEASGPADNAINRKIELLSAVVAGACFLGAGAAGAAEATSTIAADGSEMSSVASLALAGGGAVAALAAAASFTDPEKRRQQQAAAVGGDELAAVRDYFNNTGFDRWKRIYGETDDVNSVQLDIRTGHAQTVEKVIGWLKAGGGVDGVTICDAGCGTGSLSIPLALEGAVVSGSDISAAMAQEAASRAKVAIEEQGKGRMPVFEAKDLESISGKYHTVACLDVMIHYPQDKVNGMLAHLASLAEDRLIVSFAPKTPFLSVLKRVGELFPGAAKATRAYLHTEEDVEAALKKVGWTVRRREMTSTRFYFSRLLEAVPSKA